MNSTSANSETITSETSETTIITSETSETSDAPAMWARWCELSDRMVIDLAIATASARIATAYAAR